MIEITVKEYLEEGLGVPVKLSTPEGPPESYILLAKIASGEENGLRRATMAVLSIAETLYGAAALNETVIQRMQGLTELPRVFRCHLDNDYNRTDPRMGVYRYQAVFSIYYKED